jgi:hypothetical protein
MKSFKIPDSPPEARDAESSILLDTLILGQVELYETHQQVGILYVKRILSHVGKLPVQLVGHRRSHNDDGASSVVELRIKLTL